MSRGERLRSRHAARIRQSAYRLTVHYPPLRQPIPSSAMGSVPVSPLTGGAPTPTLLPGTPATPSKPPVTAPCLWYDATTVTDFRRNGQSTDQYGWEAGADILAVVLTDDLAVTALEGTDYVEQGGRRYTVLKAMPGGAADEEPFKLYVWLAGAARQ